MIWTNRWTGKNQTVPESPAVTDLHMAKGPSLLAGHADRCQWKITVVNTTCRADSIGRLAVDWPKSDVPFEISRSINKEEKQYGRRVSRKLCRSFDEVGSVLRLRPEVINNGQGPGIEGMGSLEWVHPERRPLIGQYFVFRLSVTLSWRSSPISVSPSLIGRAHIAPK